MESTCTFTDVLVGGVYLYCYVGRGIWGGVYTFTAMLGEG